MRSFQSTFHRWTFSALCLAAALVATPSDVRADESLIRVIIPKHVPVNVLPDDQPVTYKVQVSCSVAGQGKVDAKIVDYFGTQRWSQTLDLVAKEPGTVELTLPIGTLERGYHELQVTATLTGADGAAHTANGTSAFGLAPLVKRTAAEARAAGLRFGIKTWGVDDIWWNRRLKWNLSEVVDASAALGLQWTRHQFDQPDQGVSGVLSTADLLAKKTMNVVLKVEGFPLEMYDTARYGPLEQWEAKRGKSQWSRKTVPMKAPYQKWLAEELAKLPSDQNVFEIWNEPWDKMTPEEFAEICQMAAPVIRKARPNAIIGPNTAMGPIKWEMRFIKAGGLDGMDMLGVHPYSFTPPPEHRTRMALRNYHDFLRAHAGRDFALYVTEYGWSVAPEAKLGVSERQQAQRTIRQSLMFYAEDIKTLIPHWMGDREQDPKDMDQWFGFWKLIGEPRPVVFAFAACARLIDGSRFIGDLHYGPGIGAMLFERGGVYTMALWSLDEDVSNAKPLQVDVGRDRVEVADIMGRQQVQETQGGRLTVNVSSDVVYIVGVSAELAKNAITADQDLDADQWVTRKGDTLKVSRASKPVNVDGDLAEWAASTWVDLKSGANANSDGASVALQWDQGTLYAAVRIRDDRFVRGEGNGKAARGDRFELRIGSRPSRQLHLSGWNIHDYTIAVTPGEGRRGSATATIENDAWAEPVVIGPKGGNGRPAVATVVSGEQLIIEMAIPTTVLGNLSLSDGAKLSWFAQYLDVDGEADPARHASSDAELPLEWPYAELVK